MSKRVIRLGDPPTKKGTVISSGAPHFTVGGIPLALVGDRCSCHPKCVIVEGDPNHTIGGVAVAYEGHKVSCGAVLISTVTNYSKE